MDTKTSDLDDNHYVWWCVLPYLEDDSWKHAGGVIITFARTTATVLRLYAPGDVYQCTGMFDQILIRLDHISWQSMSGLQELSFQAEYTRFFTSWDSRKHR